MNGMSRAKRVGGMVVLAAAVGGLMPITSQATDIKWNVTGGNWSDTNSWLPKQVPGPGDAVRWDRNGGGSLQVVALDVNAVVSDVAYTNFVPGGGGWPVVSFTGGSTKLTVTNQFLIYSSPNTARNFDPTLVVSNRFLVIRAPDSTATYNFNNTGNWFGSMDVQWCLIMFTNHSTTVNNRIAVSGYNNNYFGWPYWGSLTFKGTNTVVVGGFTLNRGGRLAVMAATDFSNVTNVTFNGGQFYVGNPGAYITNVFPTYANGFEVRKGALWIAQGCSLGTSANNPIRLGSQGSYGTLMGRAEPSSPVAAPIVLNGRGGVLTAIEAGSGEPTGWNNPLNIQSPISGSGELIKKSLYDVNLINGTNTGFAPNLYGGGTRVVSGLMNVESYRSLGTGNVAVVNRARLKLNASNNIPANVAVYIGESGEGNLRIPAILQLTTNYAATVATNSIPLIATNSTGVLALDFDKTGTGLNNLLTTGLGSKLILGCYDFNGWITVTNPIPAGEDGVYRFAALNYRTLYLQPKTGGGEQGPLTGTNALECGLPFGSYRIPAGVVFVRGANTYSGKTTVHMKSQLYVDQISTAIPGGNALGSTNGPVEIRSATLKIDGGDTLGQAIVKGPLTVHGQATVFMKDYDIFARPAADFTVRSWTRTNRATLYIYGDNGHLGYWEKFRIADNPPAVSNGMVMPYMVGKNAFLSYAGTNGFTNAVFTLAPPASFPTGISAGTDIVNVATATTIGDNPHIYALRDNNVAINRGVGDTIKIGSGGLILDGTGGYTVAPDLVCGTISGASTTLTEALVFVQDVTLAQAPILAGRISAAGLTKGGVNGYLKLRGNNDGALLGPITINQGYLAITNAFNVGYTNSIILNGGLLYADGYDVAWSNSIQLGVNGGGTEYSGKTFYWYGSVSDLEPGNAGPLEIKGSVISYGTNTHTGGSIVHYSCSLTVYAPSLGNGPVRVDEGGFIALITTQAVTNDHRLTVYGGGGGFNLQKHPLTVGSLDGSGFFKFGDSRYTDTDLTLTVGTDNTDADFYGHIFDDGNDVGNVVKTGTGVWALWGDSDHHGYTRVEGGRLVVNGEMYFTSNVVVQSGAILDGNGTIDGPVTVSAGGALQGNLIVGSLSMTNATWNVTLGGSNAVTEYSQLAANGVTLTNSTLVLNLQNFTPQIGQAFVILSNTSGNPVNGTFASGKFVTATYGDKAYTFRINYIGGDGNDIELTWIPAGTVMFIK